MQNPQEKTGPAQRRLAGGLRFEKRRLWVVGFSSVHNHLAVGAAASSAAEVVEIENQPYEAAGNNQ